LEFDMSNCCGSGCAPLPPSQDRRFRKVLWIALLANAAMFFVEAAASWQAESTALLADAVTSWAMRPTTA
jgi:Co/Zn/Cd efflux system component